MPDSTLPAPDGVGVWPSQWIQKAVESGIVICPSFDEARIQPASLDLTLGSVAHRLRCSFLPGKNDTVADQMRTFAIGPPIDLDGGAILERNRPYLIQLRERLALPNRVHARANPKSSTGRLDVFTRVITDRSAKFDDIRKGYDGPLYLEVVPRSFAVMVQTGLALNQLRLATGDARVGDDELRATHKETPLLFRNGVPLDRRDVRANNGGLWLSLDLVLRDRQPVGYRAKRNSGLIDMSREGAHDPEEYWEEVVPEPGNRVVLEPEDFYLLMSSEAVQIPPTFAAEMTAFDPSGGELRTHYAGFFDPGFGHDPLRSSQGSRAALEIRAHDVPFAVDNLQHVCQLRFEKMVEVPQVLYGAGRASHYQGQMSTLSKHFRRRSTGEQLSLDS